MHIGDLFDLNSLKEADDQISIVQATLHDLVTLVKGGVCKCE